MRLGRLLALLAAFVTLVLLPAATSPAGERALPPVAGSSTHLRPGAVKLTRYSLVHGCYMVRRASGAVLGPFTMQATTLGQYLLYDGNYLGAGLTPVSAPSDSTVWRVDGRLGSFTITNMGTGASLPVSFLAASGCPPYPEGQIDAAGPTFTGSSPEGQVNGTIDAHTHVTAFEFLGGDFHCGRPWDPGPGRGGRLLHGDRAGLEGWSAGDGHPARRQRGSLRADDDAPQSVQRHGRGAPASARTSTALQDYIDAQAGGPGRVSSGSSPTRSRRGR